MKLAISLLAALVCAAVPALAVPVSVTVVGPDNKPLAEAKLSSFQAKENYDDKLILNEQRGTNGVFAWNWEGDFDDKRPLDERPLLQVRVEAPGMAPQIQLIPQARTTVQLQSARSWSGVVLDQNQKPVQGASVKLGSVNPTSDKNAANDKLFGTYTPVENKVATTDAAGRWSFAGLPTRGSAQLVLSDARYVAQRFNLTIGEGDAAPIYVRPGATVTGVLRAPDGAPIAGEKVRAGFGIDVETLTDAAGRFTLQGVEPGETQLYVGDFFGREREGKAPPAFIFDRVTGIKTEAGQTTDVGEVKATKGVLVTARIVDAQTKLPVKGARFFDDWGNSTAAIADEKGQLQTRVLPTRLGREGSKPNIKSEGYANYEIAAPKTDPAAETLDLGTIALTRGAVVFGTIRIEADADKTGARPPTISLSRAGQYDFIWPDKDGKFQSKALEAGAYNLNLNGGNGDWKIVSPRQVTVPAVGQTAAPIEIVVQRLTPVAPVIQSARGRILDEQGRGVAGVTLRARMKVEGSGTMSPTATTDNAGNFVFDGQERTVSIEIESADHPGYLIGTNAEVAVQEGIATISGLVAKKRGSVFAGRVVNADGKPAARAWVGVVEARDYAPVQTGADGKFELPDVPLTEFTLLAARETDWARQSVQTAKPNATLTLEKTEATNDRAAAMKSLLALKEGVSTDTLFAAWDVLGAEGVEQYIRRKGEPSREVMAMFGAQLARRDAAQFLRRGPEMLDAAEGETRENLEAQLNLVRAATDDAGARTDANAWLDEQQAVKREIQPRSVMQLLQMAAVAKRLGREDSAQWLDYAAAVAAQLKGNAETNAFAWRDALTNLDAGELTRFVEGRTPVDEFQIWAYVTPAWAKAGEVKNAQVGLARLETLLQTPELTNFAEQASKQRRIPPAGTIEAARAAIAVALAPTDPQKAWQMVQPVKENYRRMRALVRLADSALQAPDGAGGAGAEVAEKAVREVMQVRTGNVEFYAMAASIGARIRPQLGEELFALALEKTLPKDDRRSSFSPNSIGMWAFYHAPFDPAQSRVLVEREWEWRLPAAIKSKNDSFSRDYSALPDLVKAMAAVDLRRAAEMQAAVDAIETKNYGRGTSQFSLAVLSMATPQQRANFGVDLSMDY